MCQQLVDAKLYELLGERTAADDEKPSRKKKEKPAKVEVSSLTVIFPFCQYVLWHCLQFYFIYLFILQFYFLAYIG